MCILGNLNVTYHWGGSLLSCVWSQSLPTSVPSEKQDLPLLLPDVTWQNKSFRAELHSNNPAEGSRVVYKMRCAGGNIAALISGSMCHAVYAEKSMFVVFLLFAVHTHLHTLTPLVSGLSVLLSPGSVLFIYLFFTFCLCIPPPPPHFLRFLIWHFAFELLFFSPFLPLSFALSLPLGFFLGLFDALTVGWMTEAIRPFHPHSHTLQSAVLCCAAASPAAVSPAQSVWKRKQSVTQMPRWVVFAQVGG